MRAWRGGEARAGETILEQCLFRIGACATNKRDWHRDGDGGGVVGEGEGKGGASEEGGGEKRGTDTNGRRRGDEGKGKREASKQDDWESSEEPRHFSREFLLRQLFFLPVLPPPTPLFLSLSRFVFLGVFPSFRSARSICVYISLTLSPLSPTPILRPICFNCAPCNSVHSSSCHSLFLSHSSLVSRVPFYTLSAPLLPFHVSSSSTFHA